MKTKHTQGEWEINNNIIISDNYQTIATIHKQSFDTNIDGTHARDREMEANAKLIAAAPDLLKCLIELKPHLIDIGFSQTNGLLLDINNAIKKATE